MDTIKEVRNSENDVELLSWQNCYSDGWKSGEELVEEAFSHPAKASKNLLRRIFIHLAERGYLPPGGMVVDVFGGVGTTAIIGASMGFKCFGVELEKTFVDLGNRNLDLHRPMWRAAHDPQPVHVQGDSRFLTSILLPGVAECIIGSPPYAESDQNYQGGLKRIDRNKSKRPDLGTDKGRASDSAAYGTTPGNLAALPPGDVAEVTVDCVIGSPPFVGTEATDMHLDSSPERFEKMYANYKAGGGGMNREGYRKSREKRQAGYGTSPNQLGAERGDTFWAALREIVQQCHQILKPGGAIAWILKNFVRKGQIVDFCGDVGRLLEACGFKLVTVARAHLVKETARFVDLNGDEVIEKVSWKSFFRRLHEKRRPDLAIDYEQVLFAVKVDGGGGVVDACVSSPPYANDQTPREVRPPGYQEETASSNSPRHYGTSAGQLGAMKPGSITDALENTP